MSSKVKIISKEILRGLDTKVLLVRRKKLLECEDQISWPPGEHEKQLPLLETADFIEYKQTNIWQEAYSNLKEILATREHVVTCKKELKAIRVKKANNQKNYEKRKR